ncbi:hypothetical protein AJ85_21055 [Alkalihalobacillus alcalophilus ATCC 27647 = CGMCC 1.3604]|uniref:Uncharacterized protein n=1 Tax=Alkalihalobacillus alcalophilus ATCC 27647 = CGMCC 1.3604 TaxID=1218173 RepID=A0A094WKF5_ALKAL|nr:hypothetical protein [Alkalihalobacillus alcalophilus]KGA96433.1 hypothetical protein BALCAV_0216190 [Alkalihalobacillus alcalophilus ATCC 27647 = CGMCC 1.3604]THG88829.1 hypothetical protein AJ85_21055 [Alkalihalobacillus alcalophilus ATCC 27647 = CGMCC 1.3604]
MERLKISASTKQIKRKRGKSLFFGESCQFKAYLGGKTGTLNKVSKYWRCSEFFYTYNEQVDLDVF